MTTTCKRRRRKRPGVAPKTPPLVAIGLARITVRHRHGQGFDIRVRGYALISDEPATVGGDDEGPTPTELMVAGLAACAAGEAVKRLAAIGQRFEALGVGADFDWDAHGCRVRWIRLEVMVPDEISATARKEVLDAPGRGRLPSCESRNP